MTEIRSLDTKMEKKMDEMKLSIEKGMNSKVDSVRASLEKAIQDNHTAFLTQLENNNKQLQDHIALEVGRLESRENLGESGRIGSAKTIKFDPDVSIIMAGLSDDENEDLISKVKQLILVGLGCETEVIAVER